jgi:hypothetical protein
MGLLDWFKRGNGEDGRLVAWRAKWSAAAEAEDASQHAALTRELESFSLSDDEVEIEREMLDALERIGALSPGGLPRVETGHRVVGTDVCHFVGPVSMPEEPMQPTGRLLLTSARAIFVGGANGTALPWHTVTKVISAERDLVLLRADQQRLYRFRCNSYADALEAAWIARRLISSRRQPLVSSKE